MSDRMFVLFGRKYARLAVVAGAVLAVVLCAGVIVAADQDAADFVRDKVLSLRSRVEDYLPQSTQPLFMPTPIDTTKASTGVLARPRAPIPTMPPLNRVAAPTLAPRGAPASAQQGLAAVSSPQPTATSPQPTATPLPLPTPTPAVDLTSIQPAVALTGFKHEYQGWNNCGPTTLKIYLSYYGRADTQKEIAAFSKPDWDDKNVSPDELAAYVNANSAATENSPELRVLVRQNGTLDRLKLLLSNGFPVQIEGGYVTRSGKEGWMGHYKLLTGYDNASAQFTLMDSYEGPDLKVAFDAEESDWRQFNRTYLIVYPAEREDAVRAILGEDAVDATMYTRAVERARADIAANPDDAFAHFNLGTSLNGLQQYTAAAAAFDRARVIDLPWRMMWYQFGPYVAYMQTGRYDEVIALANATLRLLDDLEESHYYKGLALRALGKETEALREFTTALRYNRNYQAATQALNP
jgi:tetratricopeptide (TPR) repeat protein